MCLCIFRASPLRESSLRARKPLVSAGPFVRKLTSLRRVLLWFAPSKHHWKWCGGAESGLMIVFLFGAAAVARPLGWSGWRKRRSNHNHHLSLRTHRTSAPSARSRYLPRLEVSAGLDEIAPRNSSIKYPLLGLFAVSLRQTSGRLCANMRVKLQSISQLVGLFVQGGGKRANERTLAQAGRAPRRKPESDPPRQRASQNQAARLLEAASRVVWRGC